MNIFSKKVILLFVLVIKINPNLIEGEKYEVIFSNDKYVKIEAENCSGLFYRYRFVPEVVYQANKYNL